MSLERHLVALSIDDMEVESRGNRVIIGATNKEIPCANRDILQIANENVQIYGNNSLEIVTNMKNLLHESNLRKEIIKGKEVLSTDSNKEVDHINSYNMGEEVTLGKIF